MEKIILEILNIFKSNGYEAYIIGGYPRDKYMNRITNDVDICTSALPEEIKSIFPNTKLRKYGSCKVNYNDITVEVTTFRKDINTINHREPQEVKFVDTLEEDILRRDFIINTLAISSDNKYIDIMGARSDIDNKVIRTVKDPDISFNEDALRILRAIRFSVELDFNLDEKVEKAINDYKHLLDEIPQFNIKREISKILKYDNGVDILNKYGLNKYLDIMEK